MGFGAGDGLRERETESAASTRRRWCVVGDLVSDLFDLFI